VGRKKNPPDIEKFTQHLMTSVNKIMDPEYDQKAVKLMALIKNRRFLNNIARQDVAVTLRVVADRINLFADDITPEGLANG